MTLPLRAREKKSSSTHQNTDTSFPNQETLTSHLYKPTHSEETALRAARRSLLGEAPD